MAKKKKNKSLIKEYFEWGLGEDDFVEDHFSALFIIKIFKVPMGLRIMKKLSLYVFLVLLFFPAKLYAKTFSWKDYTSNVKKMQITSKNMQALLNEMILKISEEML